MTLMSVSLEYFGEREGRSLGFALGAFASPPDAPVSVEFSRLSLLFGSTRLS
jgi:hypothetical protein